MDDGAAGFEAAFEAAASCLKKLIIMKIRIELSKLTNMIS